MKTLKENKSPDKSLDRSVLVNGSILQNGLQGSGLPKDVLPEAINHKLAGKSEKIDLAKQIGAYGIFTVTGDIRKFTCAKIFNKIGKITPMFARFGLIGAESGCADTERYPKEFSLKFFTEEGEWDIIGNNTPVLLTGSSAKFIEYCNIKSRDPKTNLKDTTGLWDFLSSNPESLHQLTMLMSDRGTCRGYRHMNGYGSHTYSMINKKNETVWVKFHFKSALGVKTFTSEEANLMRAEDMDFACRDLVKAIFGENFPKWILSIQVMTTKKAEEYKFDPFDATKVWPQNDFPLIEVGIFELNHLPENYFSEVEKANFNFLHIIEGIGYSPDRMLQSVVEASKEASFENNLKALNDKNPDGEIIHPRFGVVIKKIEGHNKSNGFSFNLKELYKNEKRGNNISQTALKIPYTHKTYFNKKENGENYSLKLEDHYTQPGILYRKVMLETERANLIENIVDSMKGIGGPSGNHILSRQLLHWFCVDEQLGRSISSRLGLKATTLIRKKYTSNEK